ncbi:AsmA family protein [Sabulicella glaciei]|uniref:AsmA family protein n=1 Tax=Sabulicella glaciei TaxID=2984948 RepID=A0ABT3NPN1_9PROT|nr:AsmA family protein [Roseococcus sp. MDT2-1-1]MCW8084125.1 AsmA family protein [Roseococcus sp. MDT2-1-1]
MRRWLLVALGLVILLPLLVIGGFLLFFDADSFRPRLVEAVSRATGRPFSAERLALTPGLVPVVVLEGARLGNVEGGSRPEMLTLRRAELRLALLPLIGGRAEVRALTLEGGDLLLEKGNWNFTPTRAEVAPAPTPEPTARPAEDGTALDIREVTLRDWVVTVGGERIVVPRARIAGTGLGQPYDLSATLVARGAEALVEGRGGPEGGRISATLPGARVSAEARREGADWQGRLEAQAPRLADLSGLAGRPLPPLTGVSLRAEGGIVGGTPRLASLEATAQGGALPDFTLEGARLSMAAIDGPARLDARGQFRGQPLVITGEATPIAFTEGRPAPVALRAEAAGGTLAVTGQWPGALRVEGRAPELAPVAALAGIGLPPLRDVALAARVTARGTTGAALEELSFNSSAGDLRGNLELGWAGRPSLRGEVQSERLDLDVLTARAAAGAGAPAAQAAPTPSPAPGGPARLIPEVPVDVSALRLFDSDLRFRIGALRWSGTDYRDVSGRLVNEGGRARLDPFQATVPGGRINLRLAADAMADPPALQVAGSGQGLDLGALTRGGPVQGRGDLDMDLRGQGRTTRALAATATGHLGLAVTEGRLTGGWANAVGQIVPGAGGAVPLSCGAFRWRLDRGVARTEVLYLEGAPGRAAGEGTVNLRDETLNGRITVDLRVAGVRVRAPIPVTGTLLDPKLEARGLVEGALAGDLGNQLERLVPGIGGVLPNQAGPSLPDCGAALRVARGGREGPVPAPAARPADPARNPAPVIENLLRGLLR